MERIAFSCYWILFCWIRVLGHEILHGTVVKRAWLRDLLGGIAFLPLCTGPKLWRKWHNATHHVHTQHEELDPDAWPTIKRLAQSRFLRWIYRIPFPIRAAFSFLSLAGMFTVHSLHMLLHFGRSLKRKSSRSILAVCIAMVGMDWVIADDRSGKWLFAFVIPLLIGNAIVMGYISTNHRLNPLVPVNDPLANSLTVIVPKWVDVLHFNFSHHTEHHLFPAMSSKYYPLVKQYIKQLWPERYHEMPMTKALIALWKTPRLYYEQTELIEPREGYVYGTLGNGLNIDDLSYKTKENVVVKQKW